MICPCCRDEVPAVGVDDWMLCPTCLRRCRRELAWFVVEFVAVVLLCAVVVWAIFNR